MLGILAYEVIARSFLGSVFSFVCGVLTGCGVVCGLLCFPLDPIKGSADILPPIYDHCGTVLTMLELRSILICKEIFKFTNYKQPPRAVTDIF